MTVSVDTLPSGFVARTDGVAIRPKLYWALFAWFGVALCLLIAVVMPLDTARRAADGKKGIEMGAVIGIAVAGLRKLSWRKAAVGWDRVSAVELKRTGRYWQVWVHAPAAVEVTGRRRSRDRLIVPARILAPHPRNLHAFLTQHRAADGRIVITVPVRRGGRLALLALTGGLLPRRRDRPRGGGGGRHAFGPETSGPGQDRAAHMELPGWCALRYAWRSLVTRSASSLVAICAWTTTSVGAGYVAELIYVDVISGRRYLTVWTWR
jgi:hypothetical protein